MAGEVKDPRATSAPVLDRRSARWDDHREARRAELVMAAVAAIDTHGPAASIGQMAAAAGVSKPVLYRYFADKDDLYRAVGHWGAQEVLDTLLPVLRSDVALRAKIDEGCREYLRIIDAHPQVFFLLVEHRTADDPLADGKELIAAAFARSLVEVFRRLGVDAAGAEPWAHGVVGLGLAQGEWWLRRRTMTRHDAAAYLASFIWHAFDGIAREHGVDLAAPRSLRRVAGEGEGTAR
ncbi:MAG: TetR/AcrR family transcriptional regulator [Marmoricola sp.]